MELSRLTILEILEKSVDDQEEFINNSNLSDGVKKTLQELMSPVRTLAYWLTKELSN